MRHIERITAVRLFFLPVRTRVPLKFGPETLTSVTCARVALRVADGRGNEAEGWGETPLSVQWVWPSRLPYEARHDTLKSFCRRLVSAWMTFKATGHPLEIGVAFHQHVLPGLRKEQNRESASPASRGQPAMRGDQADLRSGEQARVTVGEPMPWLAALVCNSAFDLALHDAYGQLQGRPVYQTYGTEFLGADLERFLEPASDAAVSFRGQYPANYLVAKPAQRLRAWHLVGALDLLGPEELTGNEPRDGHPVLLSDWIQRDGLKCLKVKLRGNDWDWDSRRLVSVGRLSLAHGVEALSADFNCTVGTVDYVNSILDRLRADEPRIDERLLYVEQPFPYELEKHALDVRSVAARKPLFLDESAHDWRLIRRGRELGWTGVALKTCKTQTGALLSACWAKAHGLSLMVQDLTNPMLAQIPHLLLAAHVGTLMGVETNAMQFYPDASAPEAEVHPGAYRRREGMVELASISGPGFGYRVNEIKRELPPADVELV
jgi:L-alanine-DL-glutamate epimerase-like enolase superfamily enzyme